MGIVFGEYQEKVNKGAPSLLLPLLQVTPFILFLLLLCSDVF